MARQCTREELGSILERVGADRDSGGRFLLSWPAGSSGLRQGSSPRISVDEIDFRIQGRWRRLGPVVDLNLPRNRTLFPELNPQADSEGEEPTLQ